MKTQIVIGVLLFLLVASMPFVGLAYYRVLTPAYVATDNEVFHESQQYQDGIRRDLADMQSEYITASPEQKQALAAIIRDRYGAIDRSILTADENTFLDSVETR